MKTIVLISLTILMAQDPITFSGESSEVVLDGIPPAIALAGPSENEIVEGSSIELSWEITDDNPAPDQLLLVLANSENETIAEWTDITSESGITVTIPNELGDHYFVLFAEDSFGNTGSVSSFIFTIVPVPVYGCTDDAACNFDPQANTDDGSCEPPDFNCWDDQLVCEEAECTDEPISFSGESSLIELDSELPNVTVTYPNGGEEFVIGSAIDVQWSADDESLNENSIIVQFSSGGDFSEMATGVYNDSMESIEMPDQLTETGTIRISASDSYGNNGYDDSDSFFSLIPIPDIIFQSESGVIELDSKNPEIEFISPIGPDTLAIGDPVLVRWSAEDDRFDETPISLSIITTESDTPINPALENLGETEVLLPETPLYNFGFRLTAIDHYGNTNADESDDVFALDYFGCMDTLADNFDNLAMYENGTCEYTESLSLLTLNNLISFPGLPKIDSTALLLETLEDQGGEVNFIIGNGRGLFKTENGWSGNLNNVDEYSGYWINVSDEIDWNFSIKGYSDNCLLYALAGGNNLVSYAGVDSAETVPQLGGSILSNLYNFIIGQGVGLFNNDDGWSGNLNNLRIKKGYWLNVNSADSMPFRWSIGTDCEQPEWDDGLSRADDTNIPDEYRFTQSTEQAFYLAKDIKIDSESPKEGDIFLAYNHGILVGSVEWTGEYTPIPVMGRDLSPQTEGFCEVGDTPTIKLLKPDSGEIIDLQGVLPGWSSLGVYTVEFLIGSIVEIPSKFTLYPAFPNPFNPVTTIEIGVPDLVETRRAMSLQVYDINGRLIETLINEKFKPGYHSVVWNADGLPSGVYFVQLSAGNLIQTQKLLLLK